MSGVHPLLGFYKFNVDGATRGKLGPARIGEVLRNEERISFLFSL